MLQAVRRAFKTNTNDCKRKKKLFNRIFEISCFSQNTTRDMISNSIDRRLYIKDGCSFAVTAA